ncbi:MAG: hypothetical protein JWN73_4389 [Betaproteobacteria bacterium]|nr:hypothetical protein [Betaproteobacteria bacterium]
MFTSPRRLCCPACRGRRRCAQPRRRARRRGEERAALALLRGDARLRAQAAQIEVRNQAGNGGGTRVRFGLAGVQAFRATLAADRLPEDFHLYHYNSPDGVPMNLWVLVRDADQKVLGVSPGGDEGGEVLLLGTADLDGDGVDELLVRQILYNDEDERLLLFKVEERGLRVFGNSSYMGI